MQQNTIVNLMEILRAISELLQEKKSILWIFFAL